MDWFGIAYTAAIIVCAIFSTGNNQQPFHVWMCLNKPTLDNPYYHTTEDVWSDMIAQYKDRHPGSYCGKCGAEKLCPTRTKKEPYK